jgi:hypothetical protein
MSEMAGVEAVRAAGLRLGAGEVGEVVRLVRESGERSRMAVARRVCERFGWRRTNGKLKAREC